MPHAATVRRFHMSTPATTPTMRCFDVSSPSATASATASAARRTLECLHLLRVLTLEGLHLLRVLTL
jgi:hypothetical protein